VSVASLIARSCVCCTNELTKIDKRFSVYFSAVAMLHVARKISRNGFNDKLANIMSIVLRYNFSEGRSVLHSPPL